VVSGSASQGIPAWSACPSGIKLQRNAGWDHCNRLAASGQEEAAIQNYKTLVWPSIQSSRPHGIAAIVVLTNLAARQIQYRSKKNDMKPNSIGSKNCENQAGIMGNLACLFFLIVLSN
jgi:hypothetical protein